MAQLNTRMVQKHDTEANWNKATNFVPKQGEIIVYDEDSAHNYVRLKVGDGNTKVTALPFYAPETASKLATAHTINLGGVVTSTATSFDGTKDITIPVNSVQDKGIIWSDTPTKVDNTIQPLTMALEPEFGANRFAFFPPSCIVCEYSRDKGATWTVDPAATDRQKTKLTTLHSGELFNGGRAAADTAIANDMYRVTFSFRDTTAGLAMQLYISKFMINVSEMSSNVGTKVLIEQAALTGEFSTVCQVDLDGNEWHDINCKLDSFGSATRLRFTFSVTSIAVFSKRPLKIKGIFCYANQGYGYPSNLALNNHLYQIMLDGSAKFPDPVIAPSFQGNLTGTADKATKDSSGNTITSTYVKKTAITKGTADLTAGTSNLATDTLYFVYE